MNLGWLTVSQVLTIVHDLECTNNNFPLLNPLVSPIRECLRKYCNTHADKRTQNSVKFTMQRKSKRLVNLHNAHNRH